MENDLIAKYKAKMLEMYRKSGDYSAKEVAVAQVPEQKPKAVAELSKADTGFLTAVVTAVRRLYFVEGARVTLFTGDPENMKILNTATTDQNGRITPFELPAPPAAISESSESTAQPYSLYNLMIEAEGYLTNIHLNIPIFSGITTRQVSNLLLLETAGADKGPRIFDEMPNYNLN